jgi:ATP-dependent RNA helicase DeaD
MLFSANAAVTWIAAPTPEQIVARDQLQLMKEISGLAAEVGEDDRKIARALLAERSGEDLVAALVRVRRNARPAPEELTVPPSMRPGRPPPPRFDRDRPAAFHNDRPSAFNTDRPASDRPPRPERPMRKNDRPPIFTDAARKAHDRPPHANRAPVEAAPADQAGPPPAGANRHMNEHTERFAPPVSDWATFTINIGRTKNADPKWLIPLLCRRGGVTKRDIGKIRVLVKETHVEIASAASVRFAEAVRQPDPKDPKIHIERLDAE